MIDTNLDQLGKQVQSIQPQSKAKLIGKIGKEGYRAEELRQLINDLTDTILQGYPTSDFNQRNNWITGFPHTIIKRDENNARNDILSICNHLISVGRLADGRWPMSIFIDNVGVGLKGYTLGKQLKGLGEKIEIVLVEFERKREITESSQDSVTIQSGSKDPEDKRGQITQTAKPTPETFLPAEKSQVTIIDTRQIGEKIPEEERKRKIGERKKFLQRARKQIAEVNHRIKKYEDAYQDIEPYVKSASLLEDYIELCSECDFEDKSPTNENLKAMRRQKDQIIRNCQMDNFEEWIKDLQLPDQDERVAVHKAYCDQAIRCAQRLQEQLTHDCDRQILMRDLENLTTSVSRLLTSWTKTQEKLLTDINKRLDQVRLDLARQSVP